MKKLLVLALLIARECFGQGTPFPTNIISGRTDVYKAGSAMNFDTTFTMSGLDGTWTANYTQLKNAFSGAAGFPLQADGNGNGFSITNLFSLTLASTNGGSMTLLGPTGSGTAGGITNFGVFFQTNSATGAYALIDTNQFLFINQIVLFTNNPTSLPTIDAKLGYEQYLSTNNAVNVTGFVHFSSPTLTSVELVVSNSSGGNIAFTWPASVRLYGTNSGTSLNVPSTKVLRALFEVGPFGTNMFAVTSN